MGSGMNTVVMNNDGAIAVAIAQVIHQFVLEGLFI